jgi:hypothetical protein
MRLHHVFILIGGVPDADRNWRGRASIAHFRRPTNGDRGSERGNCNQEQHAADCRKIHRTGRNLLDPQLWSAIRPTAKAASAAKLARKDSVANTATVWATCSTLFLARSKHVLQGQYEPPPLGPECRTIALAAPPTSCRSEPRMPIRTPTATRAIFSNSVGGLAWSAATEATGTPLGDVACRSADLPSNLTRRFSGLVACPRLKFCDGFLRVAQVHSAALAPARAPSGLRESIPASAASVAASTPASLARFVELGRGAGRYRRSHRLLIILGPAFPAMEPTTKKWVRFPTLATSNPYCRASYAPCSTPGRIVMNFSRGLLLWILGVPIPIILLLALFWHH